MDILKLKNIQIELSKKVNLTDKIDIDKASTFAGVDCSFIQRGDQTYGFACIVVVGRKFDILDISYSDGKVDFPYIPTFLAFRELPLIIKAYKKLKLKPDVFIFDGQGILHPRKIGIASHFGVITDTVTVGCGKSYLCGEFVMPQNKNLAKSPIYIDNELCGYALRVKKNTNPIFISPGNNICVESSLYVIIKMLNGYKLPEPVRLAHNFLKIYRNEFKELKDG